MDLPQDPPPAHGQCSQRFSSRDGTAPSAGNHPTVSFPGARSLPLKLAWSRFYLNSKLPFEDVLVIFNQIAEAIHSKTHETSFPREIVTQQTLNFYELVESLVNDLRQIQQHGCENRVRSVTHHQESHRSSLSTSRSLHHD